MLINLNAENEFLFWSDVQDTIIDLMEKYSNGLMIDSEMSAKIKKLLTRYKKQKTHPM